MYTEFFIQIIFKIIILIMHRTCFSLWINVVGKENDWDSLRQHKTNVSYVNKIRLLSQIPPLIKRQVFKFVSCIIKNNNTNKLVP